MTKCTLRAAMAAVITTRAGAARAGRMAGSIRKRVIVERQSSGSPAGIIAPPFLLWLGRAVASH
jgi:hypothetical protein